MSIEKTVEKEIVFPLSVDSTQEYGGDVPTMSGGTEVGYWCDRWIVVDAAGREIAVCEHQSDAEFIVRLEAEVKRLRGALEHYASGCHVTRTCVEGDVGECLCPDIAQEALKEGK
jgi:hypothetical protein